MSNNTYYGNNFYPQNMNNVQKTYSGVIATHDGQLYGFGNGGQYLIGYTKDIIEQKDQAYNSLHATTKTYYDKLVELGVFEKEYTQEEIIKQYSDQLKESQQVQQQMLETQNMLVAQLNALASKNKEKEVEPVLDFPIKETEEKSSNNIKKEKK